MAAQGGTSAVVAAWRRAQHGWPAAYPLVQFPNAPLIVALVASVVHGAASGDVASVARVLGRVSLIVWALLELGRGTNAARRVLGAGVLAWTAVGMLG